MKRNEATNTPLQHRNYSKVKENDCPEEGRGERDGDEGVNLCNSRGCPKKTRI
jgi:hypothetical protein